jgi:predicted transcriptional regulator YheO
MNEKKYIFKTLKQLADGVVNTFGRGCEVAVHDLANVQESLIYLKGAVTKRKLGAPITDLVVRALHQEGNEVTDKFGYKTSTRDGRVLKSTTVFIRNSGGDVIGAFCINFDTTEFSNAAHVLEALVRIDDFGAHEKTETFAASIGETIDALFEQAVSEIGKQPATMSTEEKTKLVAVLERQGTFKIKGAVDQVAILMGVSKYTVYNYWQKVRAAHALNNI